MKTMLQNPAMAIPTESLLKAGAVVAALGRFSHAIVQPSARSSSTGRKHEEEYSI
jgi:hypothetical protein